MKKGIFITVEGIDGSGKTTQINFIKNYMEEKGYSVVLTREPGGTKIGEKIRAIILDPENKEMDSITEMLLYASARAQLISELIKSAIDEGKVVICDRFVDSSFAYQGYGRGIDIELITRVNDIAIRGIKPDITFWFDIPPEDALKRRKTSSSSDRIEREKIDFYNRVYDGYSILAKTYPERIKRIDATRDIEQVSMDIKIWLDKIINRAL
ncbi:MAG TPA: dTMP kinase [Clostridiaceae bacterium]|nr:dTMP kinase [Clostridiaceae bacterium]